MTQSTPFLPDPYLKELADSSRPLNISLVNDFAFKKTNGRVYCSKVSLRVLCLNQLGKATKEERETDVYRWAQLISARDWEVLKKMAGTDGYMNAAVEEMEKINADKNLRYQYLMREKAASDEAALRKYYSQKGMEEGRLEGRKEGQIEGEERVNRLIKALLECSRSDEISKMIADREYQQRLFAEFGL